MGANGSQTVDLTIDNYTTAGAGSGTLTITSTAAGSAFKATAAAQVSKITFGGTFAEGDKVAVSVGNKSVVYTVTAANLTGSTAALDQAAVAQAVKTALGTISGVTLAGTGLALTFTASSTAFGSNTFEIGSSTGKLGGIATSNIKTLAASNTSIASLDTAIAAVNTGRSKMGATINVLQYAVDILANVSLNATASRSRVEDTDYSSVTTELARTQIIAQAATAMLAQANQIPQTVLSLLK